MNGAPFREILIFVAGSTPQIITETMYALSQQNPPVYSNEIHVLCTANNQRKIIDRLFTGRVLDQFTTDYALPPLKKENFTFTILTDGDGNDIDDLRDVESNEIAGDLIARFIRDMTTDPYCRLHCSLSGGRKTMSYFMGVAFQLFARQWDKLYHVLVSPEFERNEHFFYKPKHNQVIEARFRSGEVKRLNTDDAEISLIELPLIYLRNKLSIKAESVKELVAEGQREIESASVQLKVQVNLCERTISIGTTLIELTPVQIMTYTAFLRRKQIKCTTGPQENCTECNSCFEFLDDLLTPAAVEKLAEDYACIYSGDSLKKEDFLERFKDGKISTDTLRQNVSKINKSLRKQISNDTLLPFYIISNVGKYGVSRYGIRVEKRKIEIM